MSDHERIAQVTQDKWTTMSDLLRSLMINERMSDSQKKFWLKKYKIFFFCMFFIGFFLKKNEWFAHSLFFGERCEQIAQVVHQKWATMSHSLMLLRGNERSWGNRTGCSPKMSESLVVLSESLIHSFLGKKRVLRSENRWANFQPCLTLPAGPASLHRRTGSKIIKGNAWFNSQRGLVVPPPLFLSRYIIHLWWGPWLSMVHWFISQ